MLPKMNEINRDTIDHVDSGMDDLLKPQSPSTSKNGNAGFKIGSGTYVWGWSQYVLTYGIFLWSWYHVANRTGGELWHFLFTIPLGWGIYGIWMISHDCLHGAAFPAEWSLTNKLMGYITLDCYLFSSRRWIIVHHKEHHAYPVSSFDTQRLEGVGLLAECYNILKLILKYIFSDVWDLLGLNPPEVQKQVNKDIYWHEYLGMFFRLMFWYSLGWKEFIAMVAVAVVIIAFFGLLSHSSNTMNKPAKGWRQKQLQTTVDFFPGNYLAELLYGGLNAHATHHVWPHLPRGAHGWAAKKLGELEPNHYRRHDTFAEAFNFWWTRVNPPPLAQCPNPKEYYSAYREPMLF